MMGNMSDSSLNSHYTQQDVVHIEEGKEAGKKCDYGSRKFQSEVGAERS